MLVESSIGPYWDGSRMTSTRSKDAKQGNESYSSNEADSTIKTEDLETSAKQSQTKTRKQLTLQPSSRSTRKDSVPMEINDKGQPVNS